MRILALDPSEYRVGWARGEAGTKPEVSVYKLRAKGEDTEQAIDKFAVWLWAQLKEHEIELLTVEHFLPSGAMKKGTGGFSREGQVGLGYSARTVAAVAGVEYRSPYAATIRKHFCGQANAGDRADTKLMVIRQAQLLGYIPRDCFEDNMADAAALFDFSSSLWGGKAAVFQLMETTR